jgi:hypothetical protein
LFFNWKRKRKRNIWIEWLYFFEWYFICFSNTKTIDWFSYDHFLWINYTIWYSISSSTLIPQFSHFLCTYWNYFRKINNRFICSLLLLKNSWSKINKFRSILSSTLWKTNFSYLKRIIRNSSFSHFSLNATKSFFLETYFHENLTDIEQMN